METKPVTMIRGLNWPIITFFAVTLAGTLFGVPWYWHRFGVSLSEMLLFIFFIVVTGMSVTVGYHRLFAHQTFKTNKIVQFFILFFGAAAFEQSALMWSSGHRDHHRYVDTELDPYSIKKGFWYAHMGWMTLWKQEPDYSNVKDLQKNPLVMHQHKYYILWSGIAGIAFPVFLGALMGHALGALFFSVFFRIVFVHHSTFCINSVCHTFGKATYDIDSTAKDHWFVAFLTNGEGYHNFHHRFPADYRNGIRWYQWDPSKWTIALLAKLRLAYDLKKASRFSILEARLAAEHMVFSRKLQMIHGPHFFKKIQDHIQPIYAELLQSLLRWEQSLIQHKTQAKEARSHFYAARRRWEILTKFYTVSFNPQL